MLTNPQAVAALQGLSASDTSLFHRFGFGKREENGQQLYDVTFKTPDIFPVVSKLTCNSHWLVSTVFLL